MANTAEFEDDDTLTEYLGEQLATNRLAIILGAGVSVPFKLPTWETLLKRLFKTKGATPPRATDLKRKAEYFQSTYYKNDDNGFLDAVHESLYRTVNSSYEVMRRSDTLAAIASLAMTSRRGSASQVITFNWDDLLETYLEYHGFVTTPIASAVHWTTATDVCVFHPHGFLPLSNKRKRSSKIVFDQWSYTSIMGEKGRLWRESLSAVMKSRTCLFIGLSGNDDNLDLLLGECMDSHASTTEHSANWGIVYTSGKSQAEIEFWRKRKVFPVIVRDFEVDLPQRLFRISQAAARFVS
jgi:hypothetical protein